MTSDGVFDKVKKILADILQMNEEEIFLGSSLFDELGLESVDLLDLNFRLEKEFGIDIAVGELWNFDEEIFKNDIILDGKLTETGLYEIKKLFPFTDLSDLKSEMPLYDLYSLVTPKMIRDFVQMKLK